MERARARAAKQEARGETLPIILGGRTIATLGAEFPLDVLEPLADINLDIALLFQQAVSAANAEGDNAASIELIVNILAANPDLPREFIAAVKEIGRRLLGEDGYSAFVAARPTPWDVAALASVLFTWYGVSLGEQSRSSAAASGSGETSNTISGPTVSASTPATSGEQLTIPTSSASAA
jgi:hypothetical protein